MNFEKLKPGYTKYHDKHFPFETKCLIPNYPHDWGTQYFYDTDRNIRIKITHYSYARPEIRIRTDKPSPDTVGAFITWANTVYPLTIKKKK